VPAVQQKRISAFMTAVQGRWLWRQFSGWPLTGKSGKQ
jgi:hypothetical protein